ncbi:type II toxin-antitoxin system HicB family antitoxin [Halospeciosus flavus]
MDSSLNPHLIEQTEWWVAIDRTTGIASQGRTRTAALNNLEEAVAVVFS